MEKSKPKSNIFEVFFLFLKLGTISFGGPAAHIALMEEEVVHRRKWVSREYFLDLLSVTNLVPGPNALEMAIHLGFCHGGWVGMLLGGLAFMSPAVVISLLLAVAYVQWGSLPAVEALFFGINPVIVAVVFFSAYRLGKTSFRKKPMMILGAACLIAALLEVNEVLILLGAGAVGLLLYCLPRMPEGFAAGLWLPILFEGDPPVKLTALFFFFLKVGALLFGSGMVLYAFIQQDVVARFGWLTGQQLIDAIAVGQMSPGPVSSSATFIGYLVAGLPGALVATLGIITPSFLIVSLLSKLLPVLQRSKAVQAFLSGVTAGAVALIVSVGISLLRTAVSDVWSLLIFLAACVLRLFAKVETIWLVLGGAVVGFVLRGV